jgi:hypothetical protein
MANSTSTTTDANGLYKYDPSKTAAIIAAGLFGLSAQFHLFQMIRKKTWFYMPMTMGAFSKFLSQFLQPIDSPRIIES